MSNRNNFSQHRGRNYSDPTPSRYNTKYNQRGGAKNYRPQPNRPTNHGDDLDTLMVSIGRHLTTDGNPSQESYSSGRIVNHNKGSQHSKKKKNSSTSQMGWWRITVQQAGTIGKERVMTALQGKCVRPFLPYHVCIFLSLIKMKFKFSV